jgi:hypothetical protein
VSPPARRPRGPSEVAVRMYRVGFGDCFLLSLAWARAPRRGEPRERHVLIDFGTSGHAAGGPDQAAIARDIAERCGGRLDVVVCTHRHRDHLSGFGDRDAQAALRSLAPRRVIRPWTDDPALSEDATHPRGAVAHRFARALAAGQRLGEAGHARFAGARGLRGEIAALADDQRPNGAALAFLDELAGDGRGRYLAFGDDPGLDELLPGVEVRVLGPPTIERWPQMTRQAADNASEYWLRLSAAALDQAADRLASLLEDGAPPVAEAADGAAAPLPGQVRWLVGRLRRQREHQVFRMCELVDDALNNTSVILLVRAGERTLLFPGDAQWENWSYALTGPESAPLAPLLAGVELYKVGHHGSRNATPKRLYAAWTAPDAAAHPMVAMMSTRPGQHGRTERTAVPQGALVKGLTERMTLVRTDDPDWPEGALAAEVVASTAGPPAWERRWVTPG